MTSWVFFFFLFFFFLFFFLFLRRDLVAEISCPLSTRYSRSSFLFSFYCFLIFEEKTWLFFFLPFLSFFFYFSSIPFLLLLLIHPRSSREEALNEGLFLVLLTGFSCSRSLNSTLLSFPELHLALVPWTPPCRFSVWSCLLPYCIKSSALRFPLPLLFACQAPFKTKVTIPCWEGGLRERRSRKTTAHEEKASHLGLCSPADCYHFPELQHLPLFTNGCCGEAGVCARSNPFW